MSWLFYRSRNLENFLPWSTVIILIFAPKRFTKCSKTLLMASFVRLGVGIVRNNLVWSSTKVTKQSLSFQRLERIVSTFPCQKPGQLLILSGRFSMIWSTWKRPLVLFLRCWRTLRLDRTSSEKSNLPWFSQLYKVDVSSCN